MAELKLQLASGWREVEPRNDAPDMLVETAGRLSLISSDFMRRYDFGSVGPVDCPIAYNAKAHIAYRYVSSPRAGGEDFSQIRAYNLKDGTQHAVKHLELNQWVLWLFEWIGSNEAEAGSLYGLIASDVTDVERVHLKHELFLMNPLNPAVRKRPLCRDAYAPIACDLRRRLILFVGAEGIYTVSFSGERQGSLSLSDAAMGRGADFAKDQSTRIAIGGSGIRIWDYKSGDCRTLTRQGQYPRWSPDMRGVWYSESRSDLMYYDFDKGQATSVIRVANSHDRELSLASPTHISPCARYLSTQISGKRLKGITTNPLNPKEKVRIYEKAFAHCVLDLEKKEVWRHPMEVTRLRWL